MKFKINANQHFYLKHTNFQEIWNSQSLKIVTFKKECHYFCTGVYQQNSHKWQTWELSFQWHPRGNKLLGKSHPYSVLCTVTWQSSGHRLFHNACVSQFWLQPLTWHYYDVKFGGVGVGLHLPQFGAVYWSRQLRVFQHLTSLLVSFPYTERA